MIWKLCVSYFHVCSDRFVFFRVEQPTTETGRGGRVGGCESLRGLRVSDCAELLVCFLYIIFTYFCPSLSPISFNFLSISLFSTTSWLPVWLHIVLEFSVQKWRAPKGRTTSPIRRWLYRQRKSRRTVHECASLQVGKASITNVAQGDHGFWWWRWWWWCWVNVQGGKKKETKMDTNKKWKCALSLRVCEALERHGWSIKTHPLVLVVLHRGGVLLFGECNLQRHTPLTDQSGALLLLLHVYAILSDFELFFVIKYFHINRPHK